MTKLTNYLATVTDVNSVFSAKGAAIPNSERCVIKDQTGQTVGSVGAVNNWNIDTTANPLVTYTNPRLPRWQDLVPLDCNFTFNTTEIPILPVPPTTPPGGLDPTYGVQIFFDASGSMDQVLPVLQSAVDYILKPCLLKYYNNDPALYAQRVKVLSFLGERTIYALSTAPSGGATKTINLVFSNESDPVYTWLNFFSIFGNIDMWTSPNRFLPSRNRTSEYQTDIFQAQANLSDSLRGIIYRVIAPDPDDANVNKGFYQAVFKGQGNYAGQYGLANNIFAELVDDVNPDGNAVYYANLIISGMNSIGFSITC